jgi:hypothetical protein
MMYGAPPLNAENTPTPGQINFDVDWLFKKNVSADKTILIRREEWCDIPIISIKAVTQNLRVPSMQRNSARACHFLGIVPTRARSNSNVENNRGASRAARDRRMPYRSTDTVNAKPPGHAEA